LVTHADLPRNEFGYLDLLTRVTLRRDDVVKKRPERLGESGIT
jgi:hypothetical protein